jgi:hypothetical protein
MESRVDGVMEATLKSVKKRVRRMRVLYALQAVAACTIAVAALTIVVADLALVAAWTVPEPHNVLPIAKAALSTLAAVMGIYLLALPLHRDLPLRGFVRMLERKLGRESYILSACELAGEDLALNAWSPSLLEELAASAQADLRQVALISLRPASLLYYSALTFTVLLGLSLLSAMVFPNRLVTAATRLVTVAPAATLEGAHGGSARPRPDKGTGAELPPCRNVRLLVRPPAYVRQEPFPVPWGGEARVLAGSTVQVTCEGAAPGRDLVLEESARGIRRAWPFSAPAASSAGGEAPAAAILAEETSVLAITSTKTGRQQRGRLLLSVVKDQAPRCTLVQPAADLKVAPGASVSLLVEASDDWGLAAVTAWYAVEGLDPQPVPLELARASGETRLLSQRKLPVSAFGAEPADRVTLSIEVDDANDLTGPGRCTTDRRVLTISSPLGDQQETIARIARLRDTAVDLLGGAVVLAAADDPDPTQTAAFIAALGAYGTTLETAGAALGLDPLVKPEDLRRVTGLATSVEPLLAQSAQAQPQGSRIRAFLQASNRELEQHALVLDGVTEKLLGEYLFHVSGRVQVEVARLLSLSKESSAQEGGLRAIRRGLMKIRRAAGRVVAFKSSLLPTLPVLFTPVAARAEEDWFAKMEATAGRLSTGPVPATPEQWRSELEALAVAAEMAASSVEGAYARSMNRLSSSFHSAQTEMSQRLRTAMEVNARLKAEIEALIAEAQAQTQDFIKQRRTIEAVRDVAHKANNLSRVARRFRATAYLNVDRKQVLEFNEKLTRLKNRIALLKVDEALTLAQELAALTQSMEFSLNLPIQYSKDPAQVEKSRKELGKVKEARHLAETIEARLSVIRPQRTRLLSLKTERLETLLAELEKLQLQVQQIREKVDGLSKMFPIFFGKFGALVERLTEALTQAKTKLEALMLEETLLLTVFMDETFRRLLDSLDSAASSARTANALGAGGAQPALDIEGKERTISREKLDRYLEYGLALGEKKEWQEVLKNYFLQLAP